MNSTSERNLSLDELKELNRRDLSAASEGETHITVECPASRDQLEAMNRMLAELRRMNALLSELPTRENAVSMLKTLEQVLEAAQPPAKPAGKRSAKPSAHIWPAIRDWLADRLPTPSWTWLAVIPLGGAMYLAWYCANLLLDGIERILP